MGIVYSPWTEEFERLVRSAHRRLCVAAPYFSRNVIERIVRLRRDEVEVDFLLSLSKGEVLAGVQSATAVRYLRDAPHCRVRLVKNLHAKFLISDGHSALVTSSNLTESGLTGNLELGVRIDDVENTRELIGMFDRWFSKGNRIPPTKELNELCDIQRRATPQQHSEDYGAIISMPKVQRATSDNGDSQGWILVHSKAEYPDGTVENPEAEMERYDWQPVTWNWRHGKHGLRQDGLWRTLLFAWEGKIFGEARAKVLGRPKPPYNVQFEIEDCKKQKKIDLSQLDVPGQHRGLIKLTTPMLDEYHRLVGRSKDR